MTFSVHGLAVARGIAIGRAVLVASSRVDVAHYFIQPEQVAAEIERVRQGRFACSYGQTASGAVVVQALSLSTVAREFRAVRRERGAYAVWVDGEPRPRGKGPHLAPERSIAFSAEAIALLGPDGAHLQDLSLALLRELEAIVYLGPLRQRPARDQVWNKGGSGSVGAEGQQAINALLSDALQPGAGQGAVLRSVSAGLQRMGLADRIVVIDHGAVIAEGTPGKLKELVGGSVCEISVSGADHARVVRALESRWTVTHTPDTVSVPADGPATLFDVVRILDGHSVIPDDVGLRHPTLDDVFLALTGDVAGDGEPDRDDAESRR